MTLSADYARGAGGAVAGKLGGRRPLGRFVVGRANFDVKVRQRPGARLDADEEDGIGVHECHVFLLGSQLYRAHEDQP